MIQPSQPSITNLHHTEAARSGTSGAPTLPFAATIKEAVRLSGLSRSTLYVLLNEGKIEARKRGNTTLVLMDGVRRYVDALPRASFGVNQHGR